MPKIIAVISGKGGVGKSTICCHLGRAFSKTGKKTVIVETDFGLRAMDIFLNIKNIVYDIGDVIKNNCSLKDAIVRVENNLFVVASPFSFDLYLTSEIILKITSYLKKNFDIIIIDTKAGAEVALKIKDITDIFLMVVTMDVVSVRDAAFLAEHIKNQDEKKNKISLIINKIRKNYIKKSSFKNLDEIIDETGIQLIATIPLDKNIEFLTQFGKDLKFKSLPKKIFAALAKRLEGEEQNLIFI